MKLNEAHYLTHVVNDEKKPNAISADNIKYIAAISHSEAENHSNQVREYSKIIRLVDIVQLNTSDLVEAIERYAEAYSNSGEMNEIIMRNCITNTSRLIINILNSFRSFEDHSDIFISRNKNITPEDKIKWTTVKSKQYDNSHAYRIVYKLRNFCQHIGSPPLHINFKGDLLANTSTMTVELGRDALLSEHKIWNQITRNDLLAQKERFCILYLLIEWEKCFLEIAHELISISNKYSLPHAKEIINYRLKNGIPPESGKIAITYPRAVSPEENILRLRLVFLPEDMARQVVADSENFAMRFPLIIGSLQ